MKGAIAFVLLFALIVMAATAIKQIHAGHYPTETTS